MVAGFHGIPVDATRLKHEYGVGVAEFTPDQLILAARNIGLKAKQVQVSRDRLAKTPLPAIASDAETEGYFIIAAVSSDRVLIHEPGKPQPQILSTEEFTARWNGKAILFASRASIVGAMARFDFTWFIPAIIKYRKLLLEVLGVSLVLNIFALITPLFFQVVMDKVLVNQAITTLTVIAIGLLVVVIFEAALTGLRAFIFSHTTSRIDIELSARLFRHLLALPIAYFEARRVGHSVARVQELENIRSFLTGSALTAVIDVLFSFVFLAVMFYYSGWLTLIVLISMVLYALISISISPLLRARLDHKFARGAENQSFLVETLNGVQTIKTLAVEPQSTQLWDKQIAAYVSSSLRVTNLANFGQQSISLVNKLVTVAILYFGANLVIDNQLTLGQLIAFNMLSGQVAGPILRLAQLWQDFQQTSISVSRLGDILNARTEIASPRASQTTIKGDIEFDQVHFRYRPDTPEVLRGISLRIAAGEVIGIVGASGSGKSTLAKLAQRLYVPERGKVMVDGIDVSLADSAWLRRQIGVVLQENLLFNRSIRENIALADPGIRLETVMQMARLAGAHDFITEMPEGYDTIVGEHGASLSGGQRQRIAIARALMNDPRILIFDEATSALDYESEQIIQNNMRSIVAGRTVLIIAHRLSTVRDADRIVVLQKGQKIEEGSHEELIKLPGGYYRRLCEIQGR